MKRKPCPWWMYYNTERRWFVLERPRRDTNGGSETEVTVTSKLQANAERNKEIQKRQKREEKAASFGGAVRVIRTVKSKKRGAKG